MSEDPLGGEMLNLSTKEPKLVASLADPLTELHKEQEVSDTPSVSQG